jgi:hypothetical protein
MKKMTFTNHGKKYDETAVIQAVLTKIRDPEYQGTRGSFKKQKEYFMTKKLLPEAEATLTAIQHIIEEAFAQTIDGSHCPTHKLDLAGITDPSQITVELITEALQKLRDARVKNVHRQYTNTNSRR